MKVCVLQPDYGSSSLDYRNYDPPRNLSALLPEDTVDHVFLDKRSAYRQLKALKRAGYDIFVNLCEAYLEWDIPSVEVIHYLERLDLPYTGPSALLYDPSKTLMKYVAYTAGVDIAEFVEVEQINDVVNACSALEYPLFVKPAHAGDSLGIDHHSLVRTPEALVAKAAALIDEYGSALVEPYIPGREFTVLVLGASHPGEEPRAFLPLEFVFPEGESFKTYDLKITQWHPECNVPCTDPGLDARLRDAAVRVFKAFEGLGYARLDFRVHPEGRIFFLEINFACSIFYPAGYEGSADYILRFDGFGQSAFLQAIIREGRVRWERRRRCYVRSGTGATGFGIRATRAIRQGEIVWSGEARSQRIVTRAWVEQAWPEQARATFRRYAYPLSSEVFVLWDTDPSEWAPMNHSCDPNTAYAGLNVVALRAIVPGEELTLDYADFLDEYMEPFDCRCGTQFCRGKIEGTSGNSVTLREARKCKES